MAKNEKEASIHSLNAWLTSRLAEIGYRLIEAEIHTQRQNKILIYIDHLESVAGKSIGVEDCAKVSHAIDTDLESRSEVTALFGEESGYDLEVSSPGVNRLLKGIQDFEKHLGERIRIHSYRPLTAEECGNEKFVQLNPKQKNFLGKLAQVDSNAIQVELSDLKENILIPIALVSKANLEPDWDAVLKERA